MIRLISHLGRDDDDDYDDEHCVMVVLIWYSIK